MEVCVFIELDALVLGDEIERLEEELRNHKIQLKKVNGILVALFSEIGVECDSALNRYYAKQHPSLTTTASGYQEATSRGE